MKSLYLSTIQLRYDVPLTSTLVIGNLIRIILKRDFFSRAISNISVSHHLFSQSLRHTVLPTVDCLKFQRLFLRFE